MNCKQDDLCYIRQALRPSNIGLAVTCKSYLGYYLKGDTVEISGEHWMAVISDNYWLVYNEYGEIETFFGKSKEAFIPDTWLEPIKTDGLKDDTKTKIEDELNV